MFGNALWALGPALLFAIDDAHVISTAWIASRNTLLTALFALTTLERFVSSAEIVDERGRGNSLWASISLLCAHACSEGAITTWAYLGAYTLTLDQRPLMKRLRSLGPLLVVSVCWIVSSTAMGYGVRGSAVYVDPRSAPELFLTLLGPRMLDLLRVQLTLPAELAQIWSGQWNTAVSCVSVVYGAAVAGLTLVYARTSALVRFFALATLGALLPQCAAGSFARLLLLSGYGAHGLIFALGSALWATPARPVWFRLLRAIYVCGTLAAHGLAALDSPRHALAFSRAVDRSVSMAAASLPRGSALQGQHLFVLNYPDYLRSVFIDLYRRELYGPGPRYLDVLGVTPAKVRLTRISPSTIELTPDGGYLLEGSTLLVRTPKDAFQVGGHFSVARLTLEVVKITPDGRPATIRVTGEELSDESTLWFRWSEVDQRFVRVHLPPPGAATTLDSSAADVLTNPSL
jgi:hypothetical protein